MPISLGNLLFGAAAIVTLGLLREVCLSEKARRALERARTKHFASERELGRARQRERGDDRA